MARKQLVTSAIRTLRAANVEFRVHNYDYDAGGGATAGAAQLGLDPHRVIKTLILETADGDPLCLLMHGDRQVSLKELARTLAVKAVRMAQDAPRHSGYQVGGTSPFGLRNAMPIYCERTITDHESIVINGGKRGFLIEIATADMLALLEPTLVDVAA